MKVPLHPHVLICRTLRFAAKRFAEIDGAQRAGAFAYYAFFSLFPLLILLVTFGSLVVTSDQAADTVISYVESHVPLDGETKRHVFDNIAGVVRARTRVSAIASFILLWSALQFFKALIRATNRAWNAEVHNWWRLPVKSLLLLGVLASAVLLGIGVPVLASLAKQWLFPGHGLVERVYGLLSAFIPLLVLFSGLSLFYKLAPRRPTRFAEIWPAALLATMLLRVLQTAFIIYLKYFAGFNAVYGAFGGIMALLMWIYLSGCILIFGACLCAVTGSDPRAKTALALRGPP